MIRINTYNQLFSDCSHASTRNGLLSAYLMALIFLCEYLQQDLANTYRNACGCRTRQPNIPAKPMSKDHIESKLLNSHQACRIAHHYTNLLFVHIFDLARQDGHGVEGSTLHDPGPVCGPPRKRKSLCNLTLRTVQVFQRRFYPNLFRGIRRCDLDFSGSGEISLFKVE